MGFLKETVQTFSGDSVRLVTSLRRGVKEKVNWRWLVDSCGKVR
jgi:hypothetical protein